MILQTAAQGRSKKGEVVLKIDEVVLKIGVHQWVVIEGHQWWTKEDQLAPEDLEVQVDLTGQATYTAEETMDLSKWCIHISY